MRVAFIYDAIFPFVYGGGEKYVYEIARRMAGRHEVHIMGLQFWDGEKIRRQPEGFYLHGVLPTPRAYREQRGLPRTISQTLRYAARLIPTLRKQGPFDVVVCVSIPYFPLLSAGISCKLSGTPLASIWLESWDSATWRKYLGTLRGSIGWQIEKLSTRFPAHFFSISEHTRDGLLNLGVSADAITLAKPGIDWQDIQDQEPSGKACDVLFVGRLIEDKGVDTLLKSIALAWEELPGIRCRIVGDGPERQRLEHLRETLGLQNQVELAGQCDNAIAEMKSARVLVHPSRREGFGITIIEAAACGIPVITVDAPGNASRHLVRESEAGRVCVDTPEALAQAILALLNAREESRAMGARGRQWSRQFDWKNTVHQVESVLIELTNSKESQ